MPQEPDPTEHLDLETVSTHSGASAEMEVLSIKGVLDAAGIEAFIIGDAVLPNFPFEIRVAKDRLEEAKRVIAAAKAGGPASADAAQRAEAAEHASES
ncbi:MAG: DUF2007 domain-containing protein [Bryobacteraceae bacterium]